MLGGTLARVPGSPAHPMRCIDGGSLPCSNHADLKGSRSEEILSNGLPCVLH